MFYVYSHTPTAALTEDTATEIDLNLCAGIIHQVDVVFQDGCNHETFVQIFQAGHQIWPTNRREKLRGNATVVSFREFYELAPGHSLLTAHIWSTLSSDWKEVLIQIGVLPKRIIQPMSFDELLSAAAGIE
jgi:hypothetical protein